MILLQIFAGIVGVILDAVTLCMIIRMIVSLFIPDESGKFSAFLACVTEPFIIPVRFMLSKLNFLQDSPIDWSFTIAYLLLVTVRFMLP